MWLVSILQLALLTASFTNAIKPPGFVETKTVEDSNPPKYSYKYDIADEKGEGEQGKEERRDGIHAAGRYYVQDKDQNQDVRYFADDWGYHPAVEYSSAGPYSRSRAKFALGHEAVQQLKNKENNRPQLQGLPNIGRLNENDEYSQPSNQNGDFSKSPLANPQTFPQQKLIPVDSIRNEQTIPQISLTAETPSSNQVILTEYQKTEIQQPQQIIVQEQATPQQKVVIPQHNVVLTEVPDQNTVVPEKQIGVEQVVVEEPQPNILLDQSRQQSTVTNIPQEHTLVSQHNVIPNQQQQILFPQHEIFLQQPINNQAVFYLEPQLLSPQLLKQEVAQNHQILVQHQQPQLSLTTVENIPQVTDNSLETQHRETAALFESAAQISQLSQQLVDTESHKKKEYLIESFKKFGMKINGGQKDQRDKLIESTRDLISGQDVLNINDAITADYENIETKSVTETISTLANFPTQIPVTVTEASLREQPIIVADVEENFVSTTPQYEVKEKDIEESQSTVQTTDNKVDSITTTYDTSSPVTVVVTPRPVSSQFLAPITAGVRLEQSHESSSENIIKQNTEIEIQKSEPYYLGKYEYPVEYIQNYGANNSTDIEGKAAEDIELGKTLLFFPEVSLPIPEKLTQNLPSIKTKQQFTEVSNHLITQQLPEEKVRDQFDDQEIAQGYQHHTILNQLNESFSGEKVTVISKPYPVKVPYGIPYPVVKQVEVPVEVQRFIEKPIQVTQYVEKPVPVPQPYPVEKIVERPVHVPVHVTKYIDRPYPVEVRVPFPQPYPVEKIVQKIVKQPYPVEVRVPYPVERIVEKKVPVPQYIERHIPVEKIVEKPVPHYIDRPYPVEVKVPVPKPVPVEKIVEKPVPHYIDRPYPVEVKVAVPKPVPVEKIIEKPVPQYIDRPVPVQVPVPVPQIFPIEKIVERPTLQYYQRPYPVEVKVPVSLHTPNNRPVVPIGGEWNNVRIDQLYQKPVQFIQGAHAEKLNLQPQIFLATLPAQRQENSVQLHHPQPQEHFAQQSYQSFVYINPYAYAPHANQYLPPKRVVTPIKNNYLSSGSTNGYLPPPRSEKNSCDNHLEGSQQINSYSDNYIGLVPPRMPTTHLRQIGKLRSARSNFDDKSIRLEYGFKPPLIPSLEIDEQGNPIERNEN